MINTELIKSGDNVYIYNPFKSAFIELDSNDQSIRTIWNISSNDKVIKENSTITLLDTISGKYLSCKQISIQPSYWIVMLNDKGMVNSHSELKLICQCHKRILQYAPSEDEIINRNSSRDIWRFIHSDVLKVGIFASKFPILLTTSIIENDSANDSINYDRDTNNFSNDEVLDIILTSLFSLDCNKLDNEDINIDENKNVENFHFRELINLSEMLKRCSSFVEEQIGYKSPSGRVDYIRQVIATEVYNTIVEFYYKLSNIDLTCNGALTLNTELESEIELFTRITNLISIWNDSNTINFLPSDIQTIKNPIYTNIYKSINGAQEALYDNNNGLIHLLCNIIGRVIPKQCDNNVLDELSKELYSKLNINKTPIITILHKNIKICHRNKFDALFPNSYRVKYFAYKALSREIIETKKGLTKVWLNSVNSNKPIKNNSLLELQSGVCLLRWRMRIYLDELDLVIKTRENNIPIVNGLEELIKEYKNYCNSLQFDVKLYDLIYECLQFSKYFTLDIINATQVREGEAKLSELWTKFYKQCVQCSTGENIVN